MAHYDKFARQGVGHIFIHFKRGYTIDENGNKKYVNFGNKEIDTAKSYLNYNLNLNENGVPANQKRQFEKILNSETLPKGYDLKINKRKDLKVLCSWVVSLPDNVKPQDERKFFKAVYNHLKKKYPHCVSAFVHRDEIGKNHIHYAFVPVFHDIKKDVYKISANELVDRNELKTFHEELSRAVEKELGYKADIITGESNLRREQGLRGSIDILKFKAEKMAKEYATVKERFNGSEIKLATDMADYIIKTNQKEPFAEFQRQKAELESGLER